MQTMQRVFNIIKKTGDKCIVVSEETNDAHVIMSFDEYEGMVLNEGNVANLTEEQLLDRINRDIAVWKNLQDQDESIQESAPAYTEIPKNPAEITPEEEEYSANNSENNTYSRYWEENDDEDFEEDEPYYFEQVG